MRIAAVSFQAAFQDSLTLDRREDGTPVLTFGIGVGRGASRHEVSVDQLDGVIEALEAGPSAATSAPAVVARTIEKTEEGIEFRTSSEKNARTAVVPEGDFATVLAILKQVSLGMEDHLKTYDAEQATIAAANAAKAAKTAAQASANAGEANPAK